MAKWKDKLRDAKLRAKAGLAGRVPNPVARVRATVKAANEATEIIRSLEAAGVMHWDPEIKREKISTYITAKLYEYIPLDKEFTEEQTADAIHRSVVEAFPDLSDELRRHAERMVGIQVTKARTGKRLTARGWR